MALAPPDQRMVQLPQLRLCYFEWPGDPALPTIVLAHANGFHARCWDGVVGQLGDHRVIALDQRGHGRSDKVPPYIWASYGGDLAAFLQALGIEQALGVGHSMGGHATLQAAMAVPDAYARLVLVDPVVLPPASYSRHADLAAADHPVSKRRNRWRDWREMFERFQDRRPFSLWDRSVLEAYCRWGILPDPESDDYVLACPPLVEAANYTQSTGSNLIDRLGEVPHPALVLRAMARPEGERDIMDFSASPTWPGLADALPQGRDLYLPELTHFMPMQNPARIATILLEECAAISR